MTDAPALQLSSSVAPALEAILNDPRLTPKVQQRAMEIFLKLEGLPIGDPHTHYNVGQIVNDVAWENPTQVFLGRPPTTLAGGNDYGFDHYIAQLMADQGVPPRLIFGTGEDTSSEFEFERFKAMITALSNAEGSEVAGWVKIALEDVFDINDEIEPENAKAIWDQLERKIMTRDFKPQKFLKDRGVEFALTTDKPEDDLELHGKDHGGPKLIPTWRPDDALILKNQEKSEGRYNFGNWIQNLQKAIGREINNLDDLETALDERMDFFKERGCVASDLGIANFTATECSRSEANSILQEALRGQTIRPEDQEKWHSYMLEFLLTKNAEKGFRQYIHQGPSRDQNTAIYGAVGPDTGIDGPGEDLNVQAFVRLLNKLNSKEISTSLDGTGLAPTIIFPLHRRDYVPVLENIRSFNYNSAGIKGKLQLGPAWWGGDTKEVNDEVIKEQRSRGTLAHWIGMLSDARSLPMVIARMKEFRAVHAVRLALDFPGKSIDAIVEKFGKTVCYDNCAAFLGLDKLRLEKLS